MGYVVVAECAVEVEWAARRTASAKGRMEAGKMVAGAREAEGLEGKLMAVSAAEMWGAYEAEVAEVVAKAAAGMALAAATVAGMWGA